jgi:hypothetical protein
MYATNSELAGNLVHVWRVELQRSECASFFIIQQHPLEYMK